MDLNRIAELARDDPGRKFLSIAHLLTPQALYEAFSRLRKNASAGVDRLTYAEYEPQARERIELLHEKLCPSGKAAGRRSPCPVRKAATAVSSNSTATDRITGSGSARS